MPEPNKIQITIPTDFKLGPDQYLVWDEADGVDFNGMNVLDKDGNIIGSITDQGGVVNGRLHAEATIENAKIFDKFMKDFKQRTTVGYSMADNKKKKTIPGEQVKAIGSKAKHTLDRTKAGQPIKERVKTKEV